MMILDNLIMMKQHNRKKRDEDSDDDDDSEQSNEVNTDNTARYIPIAKLGDKPKTKKIVINISDTQYPIVEEVAQELGWVVQRGEGFGDWDLWWTDRQIEPNTLFRMHLHQRINHFPGIYILAHKNLLGLNLMAMKQHYPEQYDFFPDTWTIPLQFSQFRHQYESLPKGTTRTYIVKPEALSQGKGIFLTRNIQDIINGHKYVIQRYVKKPLLIDRLKFDLRIYVLLAGTDPLRLYIYHQGLTRFATEPYQQPTNDNLARNFMHLTNYSLNKHNPNYTPNHTAMNEQKGHKRSLSSTYQRLANDGIDVQELKTRIDEAIVKTVISGLPGIQHQYRYCQPEQYHGNMCFHILGFDVMLTQDLKPIVIEVNHTPSFETGSPLDYQVKRNLIRDTLILMRITPKNKRLDFERAKQIAKVRLEKGKREIHKGAQRQSIIDKARVERDEKEKELMGGFKKIYPPESEEEQAKYNKMLQTAAVIGKEMNQTRKKILGEDKKNEEVKRQKKRKGSNVIQASPGVIPEDGRRATMTPGPNSARNARNNTGQGGLKQQSEDRKEPVSMPLISHEQDHKKARSFRTKVNRKTNYGGTGTSNQLIKYTESIKKFNDLMGKFLVQKQDPRMDYHPHDVGDFHRMRQQIVNRENKSHSQGQSPQLFGGFGQREIKGAIHNSRSGGKGLRLDGNNGIFLKPKNYMINQGHLAVRKQTRRQQVQGGSDGGNEHLLGGLIVENTSLKAYSKLGKSNIHRNVLGRH